MELKNKHSLPLRGKKVAILGFGMEGRDLLSYLTINGANATVLDKKTEEELGLKGEDLQGAKFVTGEEYFKNLGQFEIIFRSPGVYRYLPEIVEAEEEGAQISSATKLFIELCPAKIIGVTGTKGKGTTASLIYEILKKGSEDVYLAGNIGKPYLELLKKLTSKSIVVMELSSFQLIDINQSPDISVVVNVDQDHLDWHKDISEYIDAKLNIVRFQSKEGLAVLSQHDKHLKEFEDAAGGEVVYFSKDRIDEKYKSAISLPGSHNVENVAAAVVVAKKLGVPEKDIVSAIKDFKGLEHRLEFVRKVEKVSFYNDSFATGPRPTVAAINSFDENMTLILGGSDKGHGFGELAEAVVSNKNVNCIILIGEIRKRIAEALTKAGFQGSIIDKGQSTMDEIVETSFKETSEGGVVVLSPAAASFDMFENYKERGVKFKEAVKNL